MKKLFGILLALVMIALPVAAFACSAVLYVEPTDCGPVTVTGTYTDDDRLFKGVRIFVDGVKVAENGAWEWSEMREYDISATYTITTPGEHIVTVKGYDNALMLVVDKTFTQTVTVEECYVACQGETYTVEGEPYWDAELSAYVTPYEIFDAVTDEPCGEDSNLRPTRSCAFDSSLPADSDAMQQQSYGLAELWGPNGQYATMYIYADKNGKLPIGIGVERQQCVLGWTAVRSGAFEFVYRDCSGRYWFNGNDVTPRPDVLKDGVCHRDGACLQ